MEYPETMDDFRQILENKVVLVIFKADWCPPSLTLINKLNNEYQEMKKYKNDQNNLPIVIVDHDKLKDAVKMFSPMYIPMVYLLVKNKLTAQFGGLDVFAIHEIVKRAIEANLST